jgi:hypothetical protein
VTHRYDALDQALDQDAPYDAASVIPTGDGRLSPRLAFLLIVGVSIVLWFGIIELVGIII